MSSMDAETWKLWSKFSALRRGGRTILEHVNDCMTVGNQLIALRLRYWLCSASADVMMGHVYGAWLVAVLGVR